MSEAEWRDALIEALVELSVERPFDWSINISAPQPQPEREGDDDAPVEKK